MFRYLLISLLFVTAAHCEEDTVDAGLHATLEGGVPEDFISEDYVDEDPEDDVVTDEEVADDDDDDDDDDAINDSSKGMEHMSFSQPSLTEEEQKSHHFPKRYRCEACQIIVHNLGSDFSKAESRLPKKSKKRTLGDVQIIELVEDVCQKKKFDGYGIQDFGGEVTFKGPAFPDRTASGMSMGGGMWPTRYVNYCGSVFEDIEEDEAYAAYREGELFSMICLERDCKGVLDTTPEILNFKPSTQQSKDRKVEL